jgi:hypothetical protein
MKSSFYRFVCRTLVVCMALLPFSTHAGMIGTDQIVASATSQANRDKVRDFVSRVDVQKQMEVLGLSPANAKDRVDALTDEEVQRIAGKIDSAPAGASSTGTAWVVGAVLVIAILVYIYWK